MADAVPSSTVDNTLLAAQETSNVSTDGANTGQEVQAARAVSPGSLPSRPASAQGFRSPSSWFNRTSSSPSSGHPKHSLLAMVPSQPLNRPLGSAPPSPASQMQPPSLPALQHTKQPQRSAMLADAAVSSPVSPQTSAQIEPAAVPSDAQPARTEQAEAGAEAQNNHGTHIDDARQQKRDRRMRKTEANMRWQLMRRLAEISSDVELLNHEVARIRYEQSSALLAEEQKELSEQEEQQLESLQHKRLADLAVRQCSTILKSVVAHKWAFPFAKPVDVTIFKDYLNIIKQPMDFATIKAKVDSAAYKSPQDFFNDMKLVFTNARRFNPPGSDVNLMANGVEEKFDERWQVLLVPKLAEEETHLRNDAIAVRKQRLDHAQTRLAGELEQHRVRLLAAFDNLQSRIMDAKTLAAAACKPVRQQHKEALLPALEALSPEQFEWAMSLVHARYPGLPSGPGEEMQFDITCLDSLALHQLMDLTNACAKAAKMAEGGEVHVTWPCNPVGAGSRGHKPAPNKRARRSPTPPTPFHPSDAPAFPIVAPSLAAPTPALPQASRPSAKGSSALAAAPASAQPAAATADAHMSAQLAQPAQAFLGATQQQQQQQDVRGTHKHPVSLADPQISLAQPLVSLAQPQLPESANSQAAYTSGQAQSAVNASSKIPDPEGAVHQSPAVVPLSSARPHQSWSAVPAPAVSSIPALVSASYLPMMQSAAAVSEAPAELNAVAVTADVAMLDAPLLSDAAVKGSHGAVAMETQSKAEADQAEAMVLNASDGAAHNADKVKTDSQLAEQIPGMAPSSTATKSLQAVPLQQSDNANHLHTTDAEPQLQHLIQQPSTGLPVSPSQDASPTGTRAGAAALHAVDDAQAELLKADAALNAPQRKRQQPEAVEQGNSAALAQPDESDEQQLQEAQQASAAAAAASRSATAQQQRTQSLQDLLQDNHAEASAEGTVLPDQAQVSAATQDTSQAESTDRDAEATVELEGDQSSPSPEAEEAQAVETRRTMQPSRRRQAPMRRSTPNRTPLASKAAGGAARKGPGRGRGRASTPAARAAKQPPRRSTSRSTAGKRRRSPS